MAERGRELLAEQGRAVRFREPHQAGGHSDRSSEGLREEDEADSTYDGRQQQLSEIVEQGAEEVRGTQAGSRERGRKHRNPAADHIG